MEMGQGKLQQACNYKVESLILMTSASISCMNLVKRLADYC